MKKITMILTGLVILISVYCSQAQAEGTDFFIGKWKVLVEGTPNGDATMIVTFTKNADGKLEGTSGDEKGETPTTKFTRVESKGETVTAYWVAQGYDVYLFLEKTDENKAEGSLMDMFDATATKVVE